LVFDPTHQPAKLIVFRPGQPRLCSHAPALAAPPPRAAARHGARGGRGGRTLLRAPAPAPARARAGPRAAGEETSAPNSAPWNGAAPPLPHCPAAPCRAGGAAARCRVRGGCGRKRALRRRPPCARAGPAAAPVPRLWKPPLPRTPAKARRNAATAPVFFRAPATGWRPCCPPLIARGMALARLPNARRALTAERPPPLYLSGAASSSPFRALPRPERWADVAARARGHVALVALRCNTRGRARSPLEALLGSAVGAPSGALPCLLCPAAARDPRGAGRPPAPRRRCHWPWRRGICAARRPPFHPAAPFFAASPGRGWGVGHWGAVARGRREGASAAPTPRTRPSVAAGAPRRTPHAAPGLHGTQHAARASRSCFATRSYSVRLSAFFCRRITASTPFAGARAAHDRGKKHRPHPHPTPPVRGPAAGRCPLGGRGHGL